MPGELEAPLVNGVTCHAWNKDRTMLALSPNNNEVWIYSTPNKDPSTWERIHVLVEHDQHVSALDWSPVHDKIVSCSHDRNAYVWSFVNGKWKPGLVILRINRAATAVKWSPDGTKFAVASGAKVVPVCHFEENNDWWISKMIKKHKSTVLDVAWHPNSKYLITGASDFKCRIFSAYLEEVDAKDPSKDSDHFSTFWPKHNRFGECLAEFDAAKGWVTGVSWSPSGVSVAFSGHDSSITFVDFDGSPVSGQNVQTIKLNGLPVRKVLFLSDNAVVAVGYDCRPFLFGKQSGSWALIRALDEAKGGDGDSRSAEGGFSNIRKQLQDRTSRGATGADSDALLSTRHQNTITSVVSYSTGSATTVFTTGGIDGRLLFWDLSTLDVDLAALSLQ